jgi:hypothetical protein
MKSHPYIRHRFFINTKGNLLTIPEGIEKNVFGFKIIIVKKIKYVVPITEINFEKKL